MNKNLFEQQPGETPKAFAAFTVYLDQGPERSLAAVAKHLAKSPTLIQRWSRKFDWTARTQSHADHLAMVHLEAAESLARTSGIDWAQRYEQLRAEEWEARAQALQLAQEAIRRWQTQAGRCGSLEGIARLLDLTSTLGRRACEAATERKEVTGADGGPIRVEVEAALKKVYGQPLPGEVIDVEANLETKPIPVGTPSPLPPGEGGRRPGEGPSFPVGMQSPASPYSTPEGSPLPSSSPAGKTPAPPLRQSPASPYPTYPPPQS